MQNHLPVVIQVPVHNIYLNNPIEWLTVPARHNVAFTPLETKVGAIPANFFFSL